MSQFKTILADVGREIIPVILTSPMSYVLRPNFSIGHVTWIRDAMECTERYGAMLVILTKEKKI